VLGLGGEPSEGIKKFVGKNTHAFRSLVVLHATRFIELSSMVFDLYPFIPFLSQETRQEILNELSAVVAQIEDPMRHVRAMINLFKVQKVFGSLKFDVETIKSLHNEYMKAMELDGKPEKGERKLADDIVIVINEVI
jgi:hypothetical protein